MKYFQWNVLNWPSNDITFLFFFFAISDIIVVGSGDAHEKNATSKILFRRTFHFSVSSIIVYTVYTKSICLFASLYFHNISFQLFQRCGLKAVICCFCIWNVFSLLVICLNDKITTWAQKKDFKQKSKKNCRKRKKVFCHIFVSMFLK